MTIAVRVPLPDYGVKMHTDEYSPEHARGGRCLIVQYNLATQQELIKILNETIEAVKRGPLENRPY